MTVDLSVGKQIHKKGSDVKQLTRLPVHPDALVILPPPDVRSAGWLSEVTAGSNNGSAYIFRVFFFKLCFPCFDFSTLEDFSCPLVGTVGFAIYIFPWRAADANTLPITLLIETHGVSQIFIDTAG